MITFSVPEYREECQQGLVGPGIEFEVAMAEESRFNPEVVTLLDTLTGPYIEPELENNGASKPEGAAGQLLGWVYRACKDADWPCSSLAPSSPRSDLTSVVDTICRPAARRPSFLSGCLRCS